VRLVYIALGWCAGIIIAADGRLVQGWWVLIPIALFLLAALWRTPYRWPMIVVFAATLGGLRFSLFPQSDDVSAYIGVGGLTLEGVVIAEPDRRDDKTLLRLQTETVTRIGTTLPTDGLVLVEAPPSATVLYGDRIQATGELSLPGEFDNFSYRDYLAREDVFSLMEDAAVEIVAQGQGNPIYAALLNVKARAKAAIAETLPEPNAALLTGILLGDERGIAPSVREAFEAVGASHVIAISGYNMAVISGAVLALLRGVMPNRRQLPVLLALAVILVYSVFVGGSGGVLRAAVMSGLLLVGGALRRKVYLPASLAFAVLLLSLLNPTVLWDVSFQLSFFAVLGIALFANPLTDWLGRFVPPVLHAWLVAPLAVGLAAQVGTLPLSALYFGRLSLVWLPVNLLIGPAQPAILLIGGVATLAALVVPIIGTLLYWVTAVPLAWTIGVVRAFAALPFADTSVYPDPDVVALFFIVWIGVAMAVAAQPGWLLALLKRMRAVAGAGLASGAALLILIGAALASRPDGLLHVWLLDVEDGNGVLIQTPGGAHILIDGGRYPSRLLTALGDHLPFYDRTIEVLLITQPDERAFGALPPVLDRYEIGAALVNGQPNLSEAYTGLLRRLPNPVTVTTGYTVDISDGTWLEILNPDRAPAITDNLDDGALVVRLTYGDASFLLTSDLSRDGQAALLERETPRSTVLQLPGNGRIRSLDREFLEWVRPQVAVVGSGDSPDPEILSLVGELPLLRTDQGGTIHLWTDGRDLWLLSSRKLPEFPASQ
jgi:competence protein ComEC